MGQLNISDLYNPNKISAVLVYKKNEFIEAADDQGFQEYPRTVELWQKIDDGRLLKVAAWRKTSVAMYNQE